jgi:hypothetical protein
MGGRSSAGRDLSPQNSQMKPPRSSICRARADRARTDRWHACNQLFFKVFCIPLRVFVLLIMMQPGQQVDCSEKDTHGVCPARYAPGLQRTVCRERCFAKVKPAQQSHADTEGRGHVRTMQ